MDKQNAIAKLESLSSGRSDAWKQRIADRQAKRDFLEMSQATAINILSALRSKGLTQKDLALLLEVTPQTVNQWVKGKENFTFETVGKIGRVLNISPFDLVKPIEVEKWMVRGKYPSINTGGIKGDFEKPAKVKTTPISKDSLKTLILEYSN